MQDVLTRVSAMCCLAILAAAFGFPASGVAQYENAESRYERLLRELNEEYVKRHAVLLKAFVVDAKVERESALAAEELNQVKGLEWKIASAEAILRAREAEATAFPMVPGHLRIIKAKLAEPALAVGDLAIGDSVVVYRPCEDVRTQLRRVLPERGPEEFSGTPELVEYQTRHIDGANRHSVEILEWAKFNRRTTVVTIVPIGDGATIVGAKAEALPFRVGLRDFLPLAKPSPPTPIRDRKRETEVLSRVKAAFR